MTDATSIYANLDPSTYSVVLTTSRTLNRTVNDTLGISLTDYRILAYIAEAGETYSTNICRRLDLPRNTVSMSLTLLQDEQLIAYHPEDFKRRIYPTHIGRSRYHDTREALRQSIREDLPVLQSSERKTLEHYLVMMSDRLGVPILSGTQVDMVRLMVETNARVKRLMRQCASDHGITLNGFLLLSGIARGKAAFTHPSELAEQLAMNRPDITRTCRELAGKGLVAMEDDPADKRSKLISCTSSGHETFASASRQFWNRFSEKVRDLSQSEFDFFQDINTRRR